MPTVSHRVTICGIPELPQHSMTGVTHVLSIIDTHEPRPEALDDFFEIDHELIRFDDVVAEYPGFEACTPQHIEKVLAFGERVHATPGSHALIHCHAGVSRSQAAAAILMCQHAPGQEEQAFLRLLELRLDNVVTRLGFAASRRQARQLVIANYSKYSAHHPLVEAPELQAAG